MAYSRQFKVCAILIIVGGGILTMILLNKYIKKNKYKCPEKDELMYKGTKRCYKNGSQGPCANNLAFLEREPRSPLGACVCPHTENKRPLLFDWKTNHCYYIFSKAFCDDGFWINTTREGETFCEKNYCLEEIEDSGASPDEIVPIAGGKCGILNQPVDGCREGQKLQYFGNHIYPRCAAKLSLAGAGVAVRPSECPLGSFASIVGKCQPDFEF